MVSNIATIELEGKEVNVGLNPKTFSTGSKGYWGNVRLETEPGKRYIIQVQAVLIGSKPQS